MTNAHAAGDLDGYLEGRIERLPGDEGCWLWRLARDRDGYGVAIWAGRTYRAHRLAYEHWVGPIPDGDELDHTCEMHACVRPEHLEPETGFVNLERKHLRRGASPERAKELALVDQQLYAREHEKRHAALRLRAAHSAARTLAKTLHVKVGTRLRRSRSATGVVWKVTGINGFEGGPWLVVVSEDTGHEDTMHLGEVVTATIVGKRGKRS